MKLCQMKINGLVWCHRIWVLLDPDGFLPARKAHTRFLLLKHNICCHEICHNSRHKSNGHDDMYHLLGTRLLYSRLTDHSYQ
jgi:hypothetical protein